MVKRVGSLSFREPFCRKYLFVTAGTPACMYMAMENGIENITISSEGSDLSHKRSLYPRIIPLASTHP